MNAQEQIAHFDKFTSKMKETMTRKGNDYASNDRLDNFKKVGAIMSFPPYCAAQLDCLTLIATKVARLANFYSSGKEPGNESVLDNIEDLGVYCILLHALEVERMGLTDAYSTKL